MAQTREERAAYQKAYRERKREVLAAYDKDYRERHREAVASRKKAWREANREANREAEAARHKAWREANREANREAEAARHKAYRERNREAEAARKKAYRERNPDKINAASAERRAARLGAVPRWARKDKEERAACRAMSADATFLSEHVGPAHVDHIVPLRGVIEKENGHVHRVSGLHVSWNLQVILGTENTSKGNRAPHLKLWFPGSTGCPEADERLRAAGILSPLRPSGGQAWQEPTTGGATPRPMTGVGS